MIVKVGGQAVFASNGGQECKPEQKSLILIHGSGSDHTNWALQNRFLAHRGINVFSIDLPGHGKSGGSPLGSVDEMSEWLAAFMNAAGLSSATILGHSLGALVAIHFAAANRDRCDAVILAGVTASMSVHPKLLQAAKKNDPLAIELIDSWSHTGASHIGGHPSPGSCFTATARRLLESQGDDVLYTDLQACNDDSEQGNTQAKFGTLTMPVTVIAAANDKMTRAKDASALAAALGHANFVVIPDAGHNMMLEQPLVFNQLLRDELHV